MLGNYPLNSQSTISLSTDADGYVIADAIRIKDDNVVGNVQNKVYYYHNDHLGTPQLLTDKDQNVVWQANYKPFGEAIITTETIENNLRFAGQYFDAESGLHYNYHRYYDPSLGRYITSDPIGLEGGLNTYAYVGSNPLNSIDPLGLKTYSAGLGGSIQQTAAGGSASATAGIDSDGKVCFQFTTCGRIGPGESLGGGIDLSIGEGTFCEGNSTSGGIFAEGGTGYFGSGSVDYGTEGSSSTTGVKLGGGYGGAAGTQACVTRTWCPFD